MSNVTVKWDHTLAGKLVRECNTGVGKMAMVLQAQMETTLNTKRVAERRIVGKNIKTNRLNKNGVRMRTWRTGDWGSMKDFQGRVPVSDFGGRMLNVGRVYWDGPGSPPGTPPYIRSGRLKGSIDFARPVNFSTRVGSSMPYARRLEFGFVGTDSRGHMYHDPPRPWARPSVAKAKPTMIRVFHAHMAAALPVIAAKGGA